MQACSSAATCLACSFAAPPLCRLTIWLLNSSSFYFFFNPFTILEQTRQRPTLQPYRTEVRRRSKRQKNWRKEWRLSRPMTRPPRLLLHLPSCKVALRRVRLPSPHPRRKRSLSHRHSWKRARSRRRRRRPEVRHTRPLWNTTVKHFSVYGGIADESTTSDLLKSYLLRWHLLTWLITLTLIYSTETLLVTDLIYVVTHLKQVKKTLIIIFTDYLTQVRYKI